MDFDNPRESPFSNVNAIRTHSAKSSTSSTSSFGNMEPLPPMPKAVLEVKLPESDRLSALPVNGDRIRGSKGSIGDFYDAYYRQSVSARGGTEMQVDGRGVEMMAVGQAVSTNETVNRTSPLKLGGAGFVSETIVELSSPVPSHMNPREMERFPTRI